MNRIVMRTRYEVIEIELNESDTANAVYLALPLTKEVSTWGGEVYFEIPVDMPLEDGKKVMEVGDVAYWPDGKAFCKELNITGNRWAYVLQSFSWEKTSDGLLKYRPSRSSTKPALAKKIGSLQKTLLQ